MRKYTILKALTETTEGLTAKKISEKFNISVTNIYTYLKELETENLVQRTVDGEIIPNQSEPKVGVILNIQSMAQDNFDQLISPKFGLVLAKLSKSLKNYRKDLSQMENLRLTEVGLSKRIVLVVSKRPRVYVLKINEALTKELVKYFRIQVAFTELDFNKFIGQLPQRKERPKTKTTISDPEVIKACDNFHSAANDNILNKYLDYQPDERVAPLLESAMLTNKEYLLFLNSLNFSIKSEILNRWKRSYIYNTNSIEGNTLSEEDVATVLNGRKLSSASPREIHETNNMKHALDYLDIKKHEDISIELMKELHFQIQKDIKDDAGYFKINYNVVSDEPTTPPQFVKEELEKLMQWYKEHKTVNPIIQAAIFHIQFELIHPFSDGNGRVGRLLFNHILTQNGFLPITILQKTKQDYYRGIQNQSLSMFLLHTLSSFIEEYRR